MAISTRDETGARSARGSPGRHSQMVHQVACARLRQPFRRSLRIRRAFPAITSNSPFPESPGVLVSSACVPPSDPGVAAFNTGAFDVPDHDLQPASGWNQARGPVLVEALPARREVLLPAPFSIQLGARLVW